MRALQFFKKYPASIICYIVFTSLCARFLQMDFAFQERLHNNPNMDGFQHGGEQLGSISVSIVFFAGIFILVSFANAIGWKERTKAYLLLSLLIILQTFIVFQFAK